MTDLNQPAYSSQGTGSVVFRIASTQAEFSDAFKVMCRLATAKMSIHDPEKAYQFHHITNENMQYMLGTSAGDKSDISMKSQKPAQEALTSAVLALCNTRLMSTKHAIQSIHAKQLKHSMQCSAAFPASFQSGFFPLICRRGAFASSPS
jgi:hypothetical protein